MPVLSLLPMLVLISMEINATGNEVLHRIEAQRFYGGDGTLRVRQFPIVKRTAKGVWVDDYGTWRWVSNTARKRFAYPTIEEAHQSFVARKKRHMAILAAQRENSKQFLDAAVAFKTRLLNNEVVEFHGWEHFTLED